MKITKEKKINEILTGQEFYSTLIHTNIDGFWITDLKGNFLDVNDAYCKLIGYNKKDLLKMNLADIEAAENQKEVKKHIKKILKQGGDRFEPHQIRKDGKIIDVEVSVNHIKKHKDILFVFIRDTTERNKTKEALEESNEKLRALIENTTDWIWEVDKNGKYTYSSPAIKDMLGYEPKEVLGKTPFDLMPKEEAARIGRLFQEIVSSKKAFKQLENINIHKDGRKIMLETNGMPFFDKQGNLKGFKGIDRDISDRKNNEEELKNKNKELEQFNKLAVGRELKMIELKNKIKILEGKNQKK